MIPGPWTAHFDPQERGVDISISTKTAKHGNPLWIARVYGPGILAKVDPECYSNARAIAKVPEMVAFIGSLADPANIGMISHSVQEQARALLAAIEGGAK